MVILNLDRVKYILNPQNSIKYELLVLNNPKNHIFSRTVNQLISTNIFKMAAAAILNFDVGLTTA